MAETERTLEEVAARIVALGLWDSAASSHWAVKSAGSAFPYFCAILREKAPLVARLLLLEGWQTFNDFLRFRLDPNIGYYLTPCEMPHFELVAFADGTARVFRHDPGYVPAPVTDPDQRARCTKLLWQVYGILLRLETDRKLPMRFADEKAIFARVEDAKGDWHDEPLAVVEMPPAPEHVALDAKAIAAAQDVPFTADEAWELNFLLLPNVMTREARARSVYLLASVDAARGEVRVWDTLSFGGGATLKGAWERIAPRLLERFAELRRVPGELKVASPRLFRLLRPLGVELPFKISLHDELPRLAAALKSAPLPRPPVGEVGR